MHPLQPHVLQAPCLRMPLAAGTGLSQWVAMGIGSVSCVFECQSRLGPQNDWQLVEIGGFAPRPC